MPIGMLPESHVCPIGQIGNLSAIAELGTLPLHRDSFVGSGCQIGNCATVAQLDVDASRACGLVPISPMGERFCVEAARAVWPLSGRRLASRVQPGGKVRMGQSYQFDNQQFADYVQIMHTFDCAKFAQSTVQPLDGCRKCPKLGNIFLQRLAL
jgi:hypothetical protein